MCRLACRLAKDGRHCPPDPLRTWPPAGAPAAHGGIRPLAGPAYVHLGAFMPSWCSRDPPRNVSCTLKARLHPETRWRCFSVRQDAACGYQTPRGWSTSRQPPDSTRMVHQPPAGRHLQRRGATPDRTRRVWATSLVIWSMRASTEGNFSWPRRRSTISTVASSSYRSP